jgi:hypothetical protein
MQAFQMSLKTLHNRKLTKLAPPEMKNKPDETNDTQST